MKFNFHHQKIALSSKDQPGFVSFQVHNIAYILVLLIYDS